MKFKFTSWFLWLTMTALASVVISCQKTSELDIPSYITIDSISLHVSGDQGTASSKIVDAWVYTNNDLEGAFELPASFPVLKSGHTIIRIQPGIKLNGIAETRAPYPFFDTISIPVTLTKENKVELGHLTAQYKPSTVFAWDEDFETSSISLDTTSRSSVKLYRVGDPSLSSTFPGEINHYVGKAEITNDSVIFECVSHDSFVFSKTLPEEKDYVFLELNYKTNTPLTVGLFIYGTQIVQQGVVVINPSTNWNKIYVNLTPTVLLNMDATKFKVYFAAMKTTGADNAEIFIDNIKLLHF
jgi:hypothetical protein